MTLLEVSVIVLCYILLLIGIVRLVRGGGE